jgi:biopolymer transport protein ExbB
VSAEELFQLVKLGGVAMAVIIAFSLLALAVAGERLIALWGVGPQARKLSETVSRHLFMGHIDEARKACERSQTPAADIFLAGFSRVGKTSLDAVAGAVERERVQLGLKLRDHLWVLGTIGAVSPFVGLFGTVWGIMRAFHDMGKSGQGGFAVVANGLSEALVTTAGGILVAVEAVILYNYFQTRAGRTGLELKLVADEFLELLRERPPVPTAPAAVPVDQKPAA